MGSRYLTASISPLPSLFSIFQESELVGDRDLRQIPPGHLPVTDACPLLVSISKRDNHSPPVSPLPRSSFIRGVKQKHLRSDHSLPQITNDLMDHSLFPTFYTFPCCGRRFRAIKPFPVPDGTKKSNPVGSTVRYEMMELCTGSV